MVYPCDDTHLLLILPVDHSRIAGLLDAQWGNDLFGSPRPYPFDEDPCSLIRTGLIKRPSK